jgi:hypothetical protein
MANEVQLMADLLSSPMEEVIVSLGASVAQAQRELDRHSIQSQAEILADPDLSAAGVQATFYQIPKVELELSMAITMTPQPAAAAAKSTAKTAATAKLSDAVVVRPSKIQVAPVNAFYQNQFGFTAQASSKLRLTIVPVPPPGQSV